MSEKIKVLLGDDNPASRNGLRALLETCEHVEVIGIAQDGAHALSLAQQNAPDVVLLDVKMPKISGLQATRRIKARWPEVKVILISLFADYRAPADEVGADFFFVKGTPASDLIESILGPGLSGDCV